MSVVLSILPIANNKTLDPSLSFNLPAGGIPYDDTWAGGACSTLVLGKYKGCLNTAEHSQVTLDGIQTSGKIVVKPVRRNCGRFECPVCYETWVAKSAKRIEYRFLEYEKMRKGLWSGYKLHPKHVTVSVPGEDHHDLEARMPYYKKKIISMLKRVGVHGGAINYHPFRWKCWECGENRKQGRKTCSKCGGVSFNQYFSPHFHINGLGWIDGAEVKAVFLETGYIIKNINGGKRSIFRTAQYQLSHCGRKEGGRAFTWFGSLSYKKFKAGRYVDLGEPCPICGSIMIPLNYLGVKDDPFEALEEYKRGYLDMPDDWGDARHGKGFVARAQTKFRA